MIPCSPTIETNLKLKSKLKVNDIMGLCLNESFDLKPQSQSSREI
jgi:hypothetical protein